MPINVACTCGQQFAAPDALAGKTVQCPKCSQPLRIPPPASDDDHPLGGILDDMGIDHRRKKCSQCGVEMPENAVLCVHCGYHEGSKRKLTTRMELEDAEHGARPIPQEFGNRWLDKAAFQMDKDRVEQERMKNRGIPWWVLALLLAALFPIGMTLAYMVW